MRIQTPYQPRPIRFLHLWHWQGWCMKVYGIAYDRPLPPPELITAAEAIAIQTLQHIPPEQVHYHVGFLGIHAGKTANFVFVDWWAEENELHHHVYVSSLEQPNQLQDMTATGLSACVWDLRVIGFERDAWVTMVLNPRDRPSLEEYLATQLNEWV